MINVIILDLDHTLIHSVTNENVEYGDIIGCGYSIFKRPKLDKFLEFCFEEYDHLIIWSMGTYEYVHCILDKLLKKREPLLVLTRKDCYRYNGQWWKNIDKLRPLLASKDIKFNQCHFTFIDDLAYRIKPAKNLEIIEIKPFMTKMERAVLFNLRKRKREEDDEELEHIKEYLRKNKRKKIE